MLNTSIAEKYLDNLYKDIHDDNFSEEAQVWYRQTYDNAVSLFTEVGLSVSENNGKHHVSCLSIENVINSVSLTLCKMKANTENSNYSSEARSFYKQMYENAVQLFTEIGAYTNTETHLTNSKSLVVIAQYLCPEPSIVNLYVPKAARALFACYGVECIDNDIEIAQNYLKEGLQPQDTEVVDCYYNLDTLKKYIDDNYTTLEIGKRYTWEEICNECPYRYVFLSESIKTEDGKVINGVFQGCATFETESAVAEAAVKRCGKVDTWRWTCGDIDKEGFCFTLTHSFDRTQRTVQELLTDNNLFLKAGERHINIVKLYFILPDIVKDITNMTDTEILDKVEAALIASDS